jgi:hypothetical protein
MTAIVILLVLSALYCGGMYLFRVAAFYRAQGMDSPASLENDTFHLGLCFILSIGFLGLLLK